MSTFDTDELGAVRVGLLLLDGRRETAYWLSWADGAFHAPVDRPRLLHELSSNPAPVVVVEGDAARWEEPVWVCFGDPSLGLVREYGVELYPGAPIGGRCQWRSAEQDARQGAPTFGNFYKSFWGVAEMSLALYLSAEAPVRAPSLVPVQGVLSVGYRRRYGEMYEQVMDALSSPQERADLTSPLLSLGLPTLAERATDARAQGGDAVALTLYLRTEAAIREAMKVIAQIAEAPTSRVEPAVAYHDIAPDQAHLFYAQRPGLSVFAVDAVSPIRGRKIPTRLLTYETAETFDTPENRAVVDALREILLIVETVSDELGRYVVQKTEERAEHQQIRGYERHVHWKSADAVVQRHERVAATLARDRTTLGFLLDRMRGRGVRAGGDRTGDSELYAYDSRYSRLRALRREIDRSLNLSGVSEETTPMRTGPFNELYQLWCFRQVVAALTSDTVGFKMTSDASTSEDALYGHPLRNRRYATFEPAHPDHPGYGDLRLDLWYERRYPFFDPNLGYGFESRPGKRPGHEWNPSTGRHEWPSYKLRPDISLEFTSQTFNGRRTPRIVTLDPTLSQSQGVLTSKAEYAQNIRAFFEEEDGESLQIVAAAWALCPGSDDNSAPSPTGPRRDKWHTGTCPLHPINADAFPDTLHSILTGALYPSFDIQT